MWPVDNPPTAQRTTVDHPLPKIRNPSLLLFPPCVPRGFPKGKEREISDLSRTSPGHRTGSASKGNSPGRRKRPLDRYPRGVGRSPPSPGPRTGVNKTYPDPIRTRDTGRRPLVGRRGVSLRSWPGVAPSWVMAVAGWTSSTPPSLWCLVLT